MSIPMIRWLQLEREGLLCSLAVRVQGEHGLQRHAQAAGGISHNIGAVASMHAHVVTYSKQTATGRCEREHEQLPFWHEQDLEQRTMQPN